MYVLLLVSNVAVLVAAINDTTMMNTVMTPIKRQPSV